MPLYSSLLENLMNLHDILFTCISPNLNIHFLVILFMICEEASAFDNHIILESKNHLDNVQSEDKVNLRD